MIRVRARQPLRLFGVGLVLVVACTLGITAYTLWRLRTDAISNSLQVSALQARAFEAFFTQSLRVSELTAATLGLPHAAKLNANNIDSALAETLRHAPFLRSLSLLDEQGQIVASSNPANVGLPVSTQDYLPQTARPQKMLRIGQPWAGRDFADGRLTQPDAPVGLNAQSFVPMTYEVSEGTSRLRLLMALNTDYFLSHIERFMDHTQGTAEMVRYDGTVLMSTNAQSQAGALRADLVASLRLNETEFGVLDSSLDPQSSALTAFRASQLYPVVVVVRLDRAKVLQAWKAEARTLLGVVVPAMLLLVLLAGAFHNRQQALEDQRARADRRAQAERLLRINATVFDASQDAIAITDAQANIVSVNAAFTRITGYSEEEALGRNPRILRSGQVDAAVYVQMWASLLQNGFWRGDLLNQRKDGSLYDAHLSISMAQSAAGEVLHFVGVIADISERKAAEEKLKLAASVFGTAREAIMITDIRGGIIDVNAAFSEITGYSRDDVLGKTPHILSSGLQTPEFYQDLWQSLSTQGHWSGEIWNRRKNGELFAEMLTISTVYRSDGQPEHHVALFSDITAAKAHAQQLDHIAHFDALTHLPNRVLLADRLSQSMAQAHRRETQLAVVFLDIDGFKHVNDSHGHDAGDYLLSELAKRMALTLREGDTLARLGGDEFVAVLVDVLDTSLCTPMLTRLLKAASEPVSFNGGLLQVSASLGVTFYPQEEEMDADQLQRQADQAMYQAKLAGKNRFHLFDAAQDRNVRGHHENLERIRMAIVDGEFVLHYQPQVNMRTGAVVGAEALIRWQHPQRGLLLPGAFLPGIESHALAVDVGEWVIHAALAQLQRWQDAGLSMRVSVNVGARQLQQRDFVIRLSSILAAHPNMRHGSLELEVLETSALDDIKGVSAVMEGCRELGVMFALDDFGTGYSSLTYLKRLPVAQLKIDQSFVRDMLDDPDDMAILQGVIGLAQAFKRNVIAEGVETVAHGTALLRLGCELAQGYGVARPMPGDQLPGWVKDWRPDKAWAEA